MNIQKKISGFTLVEIMITVAIIGILSSIAIPYYGDYVKRAKVQEILTIYDELRNKLVAYHIEHQNYPPNTISADARAELIGAAPMYSYASDNIYAAWVGRGGVKANMGNGSGHIAVYYKDASLKEHGAKQYFIATVERINGRYIWSCNDVVKNWWDYKMKNKYLPKNCQN